MSTAGCTSGELLLKVVQLEGGDQLIKGMLCRGNSAVQWKHRPWMLV